MERITRYLGLMVVAIVLGGCTRVYTVAVIFEGSGDTAHGTVVSGMAEIGDINVVIEPSGIKCTGSSRVTKRPSGLTAVGARGDASLKCGDGNSFKFNWPQTTEKGGYGRGIDRSGNIVKMYFDENKAVVDVKFQEERLNQVEAGGS